ncbi:LOW QUALITY PROTEIN: uncharacterized protein KIAA1614 homolog [Erethizon dorsatum]
MVHSDIPRTLRTDPYPRGCGSAGIRVSSGQTGQGDGDGPREKSADSSGKVVQKRGIPRLPPQSGAGCRAARGRAQTRPERRPGCAPQLPRREGLGPRAAPSSPIAGRSSGLSRPLDARKASLPAAAAREQQPARALGVPTRRPPPEPPAARAGTGRLRSRSSSPFRCPSSPLLLPRFSSRPGGRQVGLVPCESSPAPAARAAPSPPAPPLAPRRPTPRGPGRARPGARPAGRPPGLGRSPSPDSAAGRRDTGLRRASPLRGMEGSQAAADPAGGGPQRPKTGSRTTSPMQVTSVVERNGPEPQLDNGPLSRPWPFPTPQPPRLCGMQLHGPSVLESKVRALKEKMTAGKQRVSPTTHEQSSPKKSRCRRVKPGRVRIAEDSSLPDAVVVPCAQNLTGEQLDSSVSKEEPTRNGSSRPPRPSAPELECCNGQSPLPPEAVWMLPERERCLPPGPDSLPESSIHRITSGWPAGPGPCKIACMPILKKGRPDPLQDGLVVAGDLDSTSLIPEEAFVPRIGLQGALWKARDLGALGTGCNALSLSDQVERNRLLLQEMLKVSGQSTPKVAPPAWNRSAPERPAGDVAWESGIFLQDSEQNRTFGPKPEAVLSTSNEDAKHLLQCARMRARTRPLRASHDIVPTIAQGSRVGRRSPALGPRMTFVCRESLQSGSLSDSSSRESSSGQWPKQGLSPSHVHFEDESACEAEFRQLERLQQRQHQRQRQVLSTVLQAVGQGPLRSKPELADYVNQEVGVGAFHRPGDSVDCRGHPAASKKCQACGNCSESQHLDPTVLEELQAAYGVEGVLPGSHSSHGLSSPCRLLPAELGLHTERIRETHIGETTTCPEEGVSALDSTDTSDSCQTDSEEAGTSLPSRADRRTQGSSPREWDSRPQGSLGWSRKAKMELLCGPQAWRHRIEVDDMEVGGEVKEAAGHMPVETRFRKEEAVSEPPPLEPEMASLGSQRQPGSGLGSHQAHPVDFWAPCKPAYATTFSMKLAPSGPGGPESHEYLETVCTSSLQQNHPQPAAPDPTQQPATSPFPEGCVPMRTTSPVLHSKAGPAGPCRPREQGEPVGIPLPLPPPRTVVLGTCGLSPSQTQPCIPQVGHQLLGLSANSCNSCIPLGQQEPWQTAVHRGREERDPCSQELDPPLESSRDGGCQGSVGLADAATFNSMGITLSLTSEEPESCQEPKEALQRTQYSSGGHVLSRASPGASAGPRPPSAAPSDRNKKRSSSIVSTLGLKKLFSALGQTSRPELGKSRSCSVEQLQPDAPGLVSHIGTPKVKRAPSLQSLNLNLHSLLSGRGDRSSLYLVEGPGYPSAPGRPAKVPPWRTLSVEDVGAPSLARTVGRVVAVFPDGTSQLQLQRSPEGTFGFRVGSGNGRRDSGLYVQEMADLDTAKLYSGLLGVGDEILEVNGAKVAGLGLAYIKELLAHSESLSVRVLRQRPVLR